MRGFRRAVDADDMGPGFGFQAKYLVGEVDVILGAFIVALISFWEGLFCGPLRRVWCCTGHGSP